MPDLLDGSPGELLSAEAYAEDFTVDFWRTGAAGFWKLERRQTFQEPASASWQAFIRGDWDEAVRLHHARRAELDSYYRRISESGFSTRRVRVVEKPVSAYLRWEFELLRLRADYGGATRVVWSGEVEPFEAAGLLPEIVVLGDEVMYQVLYDEDGRHEGGIRFTDTDLILRCRQVIEELYSAGEDIRDFFDRELAALGPPVLE
jgi:hypothetical protein